MVLKKMKVKPFKPMTALWLKSGPEMDIEHKQQEDDNSRSAKMLLRNFISSLSDRKRREKQN